VGLNPFRFGIDLNLLFSDFKDGRVEYPTSLSSTVEAMRKAAYFQKGIAFAKSAKL
jgi:hypothetical protein